MAPKSLLEMSSRKSQLSKLKTECGSVVSGTPDILSEIERFYELYTSSLEPHASVSNDPRASLIRHYSVDIPDDSLTVCSPFSGAKLTVGISKCLSVCTVELRWLAEYRTRVRNLSQLQRGVRQDDVISRKLFTAALEDGKLLDWKGYGININGEYITHLRFADDIVLMAKSLNPKHCSMT